MSAPELARRLTAFVSDRLARVEHNFAPDYELPAVFAGHPVGPDTRADLGYTLALLDAAAFREPIMRVLAAVDGPATHTFYSYRVAEAALALGGLDAFPPLARANLLAAADSTASLPALDDGRLPPNFIAVLARCELARAALGGDADASVLEDLVRRLRAHLTAHPSGFIDDGDGRFDIYSPDVYVFSEPLAERLGDDVWRAGLRRVLAVVSQVAASNGAAITWGRSIGALSVCMTIELAALALGHELVSGDDAARWLALADNAAAHLDDWFAPTGLVAAHQHRATFGYRGPFRRLQMTFDCLGKLAAAATHLRGATQTKTATPWAPRDTLVALGTGDPPASVWTYRSDHTSFVLPFVGSSAGDYLATPRNPGLFETPVDRPLFVGVPTAWAEGKPFVPAGIPAALAHEAATVRVRYDEWSHAVAFGAPRDAPVAGSRTATYRVEGRTLHVDEQLHFGAVPAAVTLQVPEAAGRPVVLRVETDEPCNQLRVDTAGIAEWRSFWGELPVVHQVEFAPATDMRFRWSVTPKLRVATTNRELEYVRTLYDALADNVTESSFPAHLARRTDDALLDALRAVDVFHLHWPEWMIGDDLAVHERIVAALRAAGVRIVWTQHNRVPHALAGYEPIYALWAGAADAVIHHSVWGRDQITALYAFRPDALHRVIPHAHWGAFMPGFDELDRARAEVDLGLPPCGLRLGVVGSPRPGKDVQLVMEAVAQCGRDDVQLVVASLDGTEHVPDDPRIIAAPYAREDRDAYNARLRTLDALVLPFAPDRMLTTGTVGDVVGAGIAALVSDWPYLREALGDAGIAYGATADELAACIDALDAAALAQASAAARALRGRYDPVRVADATVALLEELALSHF